MPRVVSNDEEALDDMTVVLGFKYLMLKKERM